MEALGFQLRTEARLSVLTEEAVKSSAIEGEHLDPVEVRSSIARRLGLEVAGLPVPGRQVEGFVEMMLDATRNFGTPLTAERLFGWHAALFPTGRSGVRRITVGDWRTDESGPMQVVSGPIGKESVHYLAPAAERLEVEMKNFLDCLDRTIDGAEESLAAILDKARLWQEINVRPVNERQRRIINRMLDAFEGRLTTSKYAKISKCSSDTALRDIKELLDRGILVKNIGAGRSTSYRLAHPDEFRSP